MQLKISGHHMNNGEALENYVEDKLEHNIKKYFKKAIRADVIFSKKKSGFKSKIVVNEGTGHHSVISADGEAGDVYSAFDQAISKAAQQLRKLKNKLKDHHKKEGVKAKYDVA